MKKYLLAVSVLLISINTYPSAGDSVYFKNFVYHSNNSFCLHKPPEVSLVVYLNNDKSRILLENAPRFDRTADPNIAGNGTFGIELGNFINPSIQAGDIVYAHFTCTSTGEQGLLSDSVIEIPWNRFPMNLNLAPQNIPLAPQNVIMTKPSASSRLLVWNLIMGLTYSVYRRNLNDTIFDGRSRNLYNLIAENISGNSFLEDSLNPEGKYGYIVFAVNSVGILSAHSEEVNDLLGTIGSFTSVPKATTVYLSWSTYADSSVKGYNIYRRKEGEIFGAPVAYTGRENFFIDSRLTTGTDYYYKVKARADSQTEIAVSNEINTSTLSSSEGLYNYANLKTAVVVYQNTNGGSISDAELESIKKSLDLGKLFYWTNSSLQLNLEFTFYPIKDYKVFPDPNDTWGSMMLTANHLAEFGVMNTQYDLVFRIVRGVSGYWSYGVQNLPLPGPQRKTGFSQVQWPVGTGVTYPGNSTDIKYGLIWVFVHELQHAVDALYNDNGYPEMYHGDVPWEFPEACGEHFDFQAKMFRSFNSYRGLNDKWGDIYETVDADNDSLPDEDSLLILDEVRFGSSTNSADSDNDGLTDSKEAVNGTFSGSSPADADTDNDGITDGNDKYPRYKIIPTVPNFNAVIDGIIEENWPVSIDSSGYSNTEFNPKVFLAYDADSFYIAVRTDKFYVPEISFDWQSDGWWWGSGNTQIKLNLLNGTISSLRSWDASPEVRAYSLSHGGPGGMWDDDPVYGQQFNRKVINRSSVNFKMTNHQEQYDLEISIAKRDYAGLTLNPGSQFGINVYYTAVDHQYNSFASAFDQYSFADYNLSGASENDEFASMPSEFKLLQNYPNPFNPYTTINYSVPERDFLTLKIFDVLGNEISVLLNEEKEAGNYSLKYNAEKLPSGVYFYSLQTASGIIFTRKMLLLK